MIATLGRICGKIRRNIIKNAIKGKIEEDQAGFTLDRSCTDYVYRIQRLLKGDKYSHHLSM